MAFSEIGESVCVVPKMLLEYLEIEEGLSVLTL